MPQLNIKLPRACEPTLALGADGVNAIASASGHGCMLHEPFGDLELADNLASFEKKVEEIIEKEDIKTIVCDAHPGYFSTSLGLEMAERSGCRLQKVQHHKAHVAAAALEHGLSEYMGIACDGLGYGDDGKLWGGEVFLCKGGVFKRIGHLEEQRQLGGDSAARQPKKMLFGILHRFLGEGKLQEFFSQDEIDVYSKLLKDNYNVFTTTSTGRVLDAASALLGICDRMTYPGEPAIMLEKRSSDEHYELAPKIAGGVLDTTHLFSFLIDNLDKDKRKLARTAQLYIAEGLYSIASQHDMPIVFSGGVAHNKIISDHLKSRGVFLNKKIPPGDAGIAVGQIAICIS